jgi:hypothetical protein
VGSPPLASFRASLPQLPFFLQASRLETIGCILRAKEFSEDAISCLKGTIDSYQSKWSYQTWCGKEGVHPLPKLVDFLNHFFKERKLSVSAIKGYKSALATILKTDWLLGKCLGQNMYDSSSEHVGSTPKGQSPDIRWDLSLVLRALMEEPFVHMDRASLKYVALKMVFLVALSYEKISFNKERGTSNWHPCQAFWQRTRRLTPLGVRLLSLPCRQWLIKLFLTELYVQSGH